MDDVALLPRAPSEFVRQVLDAQSYATGEGTMRLEDVSVVATASDGLPFDFDRVEKRGEVRHAPWCFQEIAPRLASRMCVLRVDDEGALGLATAFASVVGDNRHGPSMRWRGAPWSSCSSAPKLPAVWYSLRLLNKLYWIRAAAVRATRFGKNPAGVFAGATVEGGRAHAALGARVSAVSWR